MYQIDKFDEVVALNWVPQSDIGAPLPIVVADEYRTLIAYRIHNPDPHWDGTTIKIVTPATKSKIAIVDFHYPYAHFFGPPNDEAFSGHPLASRGLEAYGAFEIKKSSWIRQLEKMNAVHPYHNPQQFMESKRHFIFAFHDSTFECIAHDFLVITWEGTLLAAVERMAAMLREPPSKV